MSITTHVQNGTICGELALTKCRERIQKASHAFGCLGWHGLAIYEDNRMNVILMIQHASLSPTPPDQNASCPIRLDRELSQPQC